jgi:uncharacterized protein
MLALWAFWLEPRRLVVREEQIDLPCWRGAPLRIAIVSDLHVGSPFTGMRKLETLVQRINDGRPDVIVLLGDYVIQGVKGGKFVAPEAMAKTLAGLRAPLGVYGVLGNHDWWLDGPRVAVAFQRDGRVRMLDEQSLRLQRGNDVFWLVGIGDFMEGRPDVRRIALPDDAPAIAITHNPDIFPSVPERVCLTLAGHTHGGQVAIPLVGRPVVPSKYGERYAIGHIHERGRQLFVTSGVGTSIIPVRFRVPPEIVFLRVH